MNIITFVICISN